MKMDIEHLPLIDWELATRLAGHNKLVAEEIVALFIEKLPEDRAMISQFSREGNNQALLNSVHRLHGAICYCGLPRLKAIVMTLEKHLKNNIPSDIPFLLNQLDIEIDRLLDHYASSHRSK